MEENPYAAPTADPTVDVTAVGGEEAVRKEHIKHEVSIKTIGFLYILGGILAGLVAAGALVETQSLASAEGAVIAAILGIGVFQLWVGFELRKLRPRARIPALILSVLGLLNFPVGTIIGAYFLYLLLSRKGSVVLSENYKQVVAATPHIRYKTPAFIWILLGLAVLLFLAVAVALALNM